MNINSRWDKARSINSISLGYAAVVKEILTGVFDVWRCERDPHPHPCLQPHCGHTCRPASSLTQASPCLNPDRPALHSQHSSMASPLKQRSHHATPVPHTSRWNDSTPKSFHGPRWPHNPPLSCFPISNLSFTQLPAQGLCTCDFLCLGNFFPQM